jgi:hypothetical protein
LGGGRTKQKEKENGEPLLREEEPKVKRKRKNQKKNKRKPKKRIKE